MKGNRTKPSVRPTVRTLERAPRCPPPRTGPPCSLPDVILPSARAHIRSAPAVKLSLPSRHGLPPYSARIAPFLSVEAFFSFKRESFCSSPIIFSFLVDVLNSWPGRRGYMLHSPCNGGGGGGGGCVLWRRWFGWCSPASATAACCHRSWFFLRSPFSLPNVGLSGLSGLSGPNEGRRTEGRTDGRTKGGRAGGRDADDGRLPTVA